MTGAIEMSTTASPGLGSLQTDRQRNFVPMIVVLLIGLGFILSYSWGAPAPEFRVDALYIIVFFVSSATVLAIASFLWRHRLLLRFRFCTACGRQIPFDARLCPYCGHEFAP